MKRGNAMTTIENIYEKGRLKNSFLKLPKCNGCGSYLVECEDCGNVKQDFIFEPCECVSTQQFMCQCHRATDAKIVDGSGNDVKIALKAKEVLRLLSQEITTPGSFTTSDIPIPKSYEIENLNGGRFTNNARLRLDALSSNKTVGQLIVEKEKKVEKIKKIINDMVIEKGQDWKPKERTRTRKKAFVRKIPERKRNKPVVVRPPTPPPSPKKTPTPPPPSPKKLPVSNKVPTPPPSPKKNTSWWGVLGFGSEDDANKQKEEAERERERIQKEEEAERQRQAMDKQKRRDIEDAINATVKRIKEDLDNIKNNRTPTLSPIIGEFKPQEESFNTKIKLVDGLVPSLEKKFETIKRDVKGLQQKINDNNFSITIGDANADMSFVEGSIKAVRDSVDFKSSINFVKTYMDTTKIPAAATSLEKEIDNLIGTLNTANSRETIAGLNEKATQLLSDFKDAYINKVDLEANLEQLKTLVTKVNDTVDNVLALKPEIEARLDKVSTDVVEASKEFDTQKSKKDEAEQQAAAEKAKAIKDIGSIVNKFNINKNEKAFQKVDIIGKLSEEQLGKLYAVSFFEDDESDKPSPQLYDGDTNDYSYATKILGFDFDGLLTHRYEMDSKTVLTQDQLSLAVTKAQSSMSAVPGDVDDKFSGRFGPNSKLKEYASFIYYNIQSLDNISEQDIITIAKKFDGSANNIADAIIKLVFVILAHYDVTEQYRALEEKRYQSLNKNSYKFVINVLNNPSDRPESSSDKDLEYYSSWDDNKYSSYIDGNITAEEIKLVKQISGIDMGAEDDEFALEFGYMLIFASRFGISSSGSLLSNMSETEAKLFRDTENLVSLLKAFDSGYDVEPIKENKKKLLMTIGYKWFQHWNNGTVMEKWESDLVSDVVDSVTSGIVFDPSAYDSDVLTRFNKLSATKKQNLNDIGKAMTVNLLKGILARHSLDTSGNKDALVARFVDRFVVGDQEAPAPAPPTPTPAPASVLPASNWLDNMSYNQLVLLSMASINDDSYDLELVDNESKVSNLQGTKDALKQTIRKYKDITNQEYKDDLKTLGDEAVQKIITNTIKKLGLVNEADPSQNWEPIDEDKDWGILYVINMGDNFSKQGSKGLIQDKTKSKLLRQSIREFGIDVDEKLNDPWQLMEKFLDYYETT